LSLLGKTGHSYDAGVAKQDAVIRQAKYIKAMDVVKESNLKKVIDVINSQQVKDTEVSEDIERMAREEIENIMNNPRPDS
jgi:threonine synthase